MVPTAEIDYVDLLSGNIPSAKGGETRYTYYITDNSGVKYAAIELAKQIIVDWEKIIFEHVRVKDFR
jgi:hypothetical protein